MEKGEATSIEIAESSHERKGKAPLLGVAHRRRKPGIAMFDIVLRVSAMTAAMASAIAMGTSEQTLPFTSQFFQFSAGFDDLSSFMFFVIGLGIVSGYLALSIPFSIFCMCRPTAVGARIVLVFFDILSLALATSAASAATAEAYLAHNGNAATNWLAVCPQYPDFCRFTSGAVIGSFIAVAALVVLVLVSAANLKRR